MKNLLINTILFLATLVTGHAQTGTLDPSFGNAGVSVTTGYARASVQQPDGKIVVVNMQPPAINVLRFMPNGSLDSTFGVNGTALFPVSGNPSINNVIVQPDGKIIIAADVLGTYMRLLVCRLTPEGIVDSSFANNGSLIHTFQAIDHYNGFVHNTLDGKLLISGTVGVSPTITPYYLKLKLDGSIDSTYGVNGVVFISGLNYVSGTYRTEIQSDGKIVTCTNDFNNGAYFIKVFRLNVDGSFDNTFGQNGIVSFSTPQTAHYQLFIQEDEKMLIFTRRGYGSSTYGTYIVRFLPNGNPDLGFGTNGVVSHNPQIRKDINGIIVQPSDGKLVVLGEKESNSGSYQQMYITRFNANGSFDTEFGEPAITFFPNQNEQFRSGHITADGGIIGVASSGSTSRILVKYISCTNSITGQPQATSREEGTTATFTAGSSSSSAVYQWQIMGATDWEDLSNGGQYSGAGTATLSISNLTMANSGAAYRTISTSGVCVDTSAPAVLTVTPSTSIADAAELAKHFKVYPNPVKNKLLVEGSLAIQSITIIDVLGRQQLHKSINKQLQLEIDMEQFTPGLYWMQLGTTEGAATIKIIKE